jgi:uncharacterized membrane protein
MGDTGEGRSVGTGTFVVAGVLLGVGLGGFLDGIVLHQLLQWHHVLSREHPMTTVAGLEVNTFWDGLFHVFSWIAVAVGVGLLWSARRRSNRLGGRALTGLVLAGWGLFDLVEGLLDHHLLQIHHVRDDVANPLPWDIGFLILGAALLVGGWALYRSAARPTVSAARRTPEQGAAGTTRP